MKRNLAIAVVAAMLAPYSMNSASATEARTLKPSSNWYMDYAKGYCRLARQFGAEDDRTVFYIEQYQPGDSFKVVVVGPAFRPNDLKKPLLEFNPEGGTSSVMRPTILGEFGIGLMTSMHLLSKEDPKQRTYFIPSGETRYFRDQSPGASIAPESAAHIIEFELSDRGETLATLSLGSMREPVRALNKCIDDLQTHWGIDVEANRNRSRDPQPKTNPATWITNSDYPMDAAMSGIVGSVNFRLTVDEKGLPIDCEVQQITNPPAFSDIVCDKLKKKARFLPALDSNGRPLKSYWVSAVRFDMPR